MATTNFNTENRTYRQLLGSGLTYNVPRFQRDYSWSETEWEELWTDLQETLAEDGTASHYMGYLVLQTTDNRTFDVIDGQQRLTTLSLIVLAAMRHLKSLCVNEPEHGPSSQRLQQLRGNYIGYLDPVSLVSSNKLTLNRNNNGYYKDYLAPLSDHLPERGFAQSTHLLRKGFTYFCQKIASEIQQHATQAPPLDQSTHLARFIERMSDCLFFTVITVSDDINAYKVFETLNARGVRLSTTDLLKNYLFSILARSSSDTAAEDLEVMEERWDRMINRLADEKSLPDFLRCHWNSRNRFARAGELFKTIRRQILTREDVFRLLRDMDEDIDTYLFLTQPEGSSASARRSAEQLRMFSVKQPYPMLLAAHRRFTNEKDFDAILRATVVISFRYNVIGEQLPSEQEKIYSHAAQDLHTETISDLPTLLQTLRPLYRHDTEFRQDFAKKSIKTTQSRNAKIVRYILGELEQSAINDEINLAADDYSLEHILPQRPKSGWDAFPDRDLESYIYRLANMVLLEKNKNKGLENKPYAEKRPVLQGSTVHLTRLLAKKYSNWTPETLDAQQNDLAKKATSIWRIAQLS